MSVPGLLQRIATTRSLDQLRRRVRERNRVAPDETLDRLSSGVRDPLSELQASELAGRLRRALTRLPPREGTVFCMRELNDLSYDEIGAALGISEDAAGVAAHRARRKLAALLADLDPIPAAAGAGDAIQRRLDVASVLALDCIRRWGI